MAWHESTAALGSEIITLELDPRMIAASRRTFDKYRLNDRITLIEGPAGDSILKLTGQFDLVFVDANKDGYQDYVQKILDRKLLSPSGLILCDNSEHPTNDSTSEIPRRDMLTRMTSLCSRHDHLHGSQPPPA